MVTYSYNTINKDKRDNTNICGLISKHISISFVGRKIYTYNYWESAMNNY